MGIEGSAVRDQVLAGMELKPQPSPPLAPWETGLIGFITGVLVLLLFPGVSPTPVANGLIPEALLLSPVRSGFILYLILCPLYALPAALLSAALHRAADRLAGGRLPRVLAGLFTVISMFLAITWAMTVYRKDPDRRRPDRPVRTVKAQFGALGEFGPTDGQGPQNRIGNRE